LFAAGYCVICSGFGSSGAVVELLRRIYRTLEEERVLRGRGKPGEDNVLGEEEDVDDSGTLS
jgi:hypothetical protein